MTFDLQTSMERLVLTPMPLLARLVAIVRRLGDTPLVAQRALQAAPLLGEGCLARGARRHFLRVRGEEGVKLHVNARRAV